MALMSQNSFNPAILSSAKLRPSHGMSFVKASYSFLFLSNPIQISSTFFSQRLTSSQKLVRAEMKERLTLHCVMEFCTHSAAKNRRVRWGCPMIDSISSGSSGLLSLRKRVPRLRGLRLRRGLSSLGGIKSLSSASSIFETQPIALSNHQTLFTSPNSLSYQNIQNPAQVIFQFLPKNFIKFEYFLPSMTQFFHCFDSTSNKFTKTPAAKAEPFSDVSSVVKCIQRASLSTNDVAMKLQLRQVIAFLQRKQAEERTIENKHRYGGECLESKIEYRFPGCLNQKEKVVRINTLYPMGLGADYCETAKSLLLDKISHSAFSREEEQENVSMKVQTERKPDFYLESQSMNDLTCRQEQKEKEGNVNCQASLIGKLQWRSVVTKNDLDEANKHREATSRKEVSHDSRLSANSLEPVSVGDVVGPSDEVIKEQLKNNRLETESLRQELQILKGKLKIREEEAKKYELLLYVREEEVSSLRLMMRSFESKSKDKQVTPVKTLRKAFQPLQENLSSPLG